MHLIKNAFISEVNREFENGDLDGRTKTWRAGYLMGLLTAGLLTQEEHDEIINWIAELE